MYRILVLLVVVVLIYTTTGVTQAEAPLRTLNQYTVSELVHHFASQYSVSAHRMLATMNCESSMNTKAVGDHNTSFGIAQIHLPAHPDITKEQAENAIFASEFMAKEFAQHNQDAWSCYRELYE